MFGLIWKIVCNFVYILFFFVNQSILLDKIYIYLLTFNQFIRVSNLNIEYDDEKINYKFIKFASWWAYLFK
jgi:hypothetical protein